MSFFPQTSDMYNHDIIVDTVKQTASLELWLRQIMIIISTSSNCLNIKLIFCLIPRQSIRYQVLAVFYIYEIINQNKMIDLSWSETYGLAIDKLFDQIYKAEYILVLQLLIPTTNVRLETNTRNNMN